MTKLTFTLTIGKENMTAQAVNASLWHDGLNSRQTVCSKSTEIKFLERRYLITELNDTVYDDGYEAKVLCFVKKTVAEEGFKVEEELSSLELSVEAIEKTIEITLGDVNLKFSGGMVDIFIEDEDRIIVRRAIGEENRVNIIESNISDVPTTKLGFDEVEIYREPQVKKHPGGWGGPVTKVLARLIEKD
tara:strand:+ start:1294 stop:1860 length:567 start_codon:yes stop_codon:yes gene_type:complete